MFGGVGFGCGSWEFGNKWRGGCIALMNERSMFIWLYDMPVFMFSSSSSPAKNKNKNK